MFDKLDVLQKLKDLIEDECEITISGPEEKLDIDSFMMMLIITFVDDEFEITLNMDDLDFNSFKTLGLMGDMIEKFYLQKKT